MGSYKYNSLSGDDNFLWKYYETDILMILWHNFVINLFFSPNFIKITIYFDQTFIFVKFSTDWVEFNKSNRTAF